MTPLTPIPIDGIPAPAGLQALWDKFYYDELVTKSSLSSDGYSEASLGSMFSSSRSAMFTDSAALPVVPIIYL